MQSVPISSGSSVQVASLRATTAAWLARRPLLCVFTVGLLARVVWVLTLENRLLWPDEFEFAKIARSLAAGDGYVSDSYRANPVLPAYLAAFLALFGEHYLLPRLGQALVGAATCAILYRLTDELVGRTAAIVAGLVLALYPPHIYLSGVFYVTCFASFFVVALAWTATHLLRAPQRWAAGAACGVIIGVAALTRPTFLMFAVLLPLVTLVTASWKVQGTWRGAAALILGTVVVVAPWTLRNLRTYGEPVLVSSGLGETLWKGNNELSDGGPDDRFLLVDGPLWRERLAELAPPAAQAIERRYAPLRKRIEEVAVAVSGDGSIARDRVLGPYAVRFMVSNPGRTLRMFARKVGTLMTAFTSTDQHNRDTSPFKQFVAAVAYYPILLFACAGAVLALLRWRTLAAVLVIVAGWIAIHGVLTACTRFRLPIDPLLILLAAIAVDRFVAFLRGREARPDTASLA